MVGERGIYRQLYKRRPETEKRRGEIISRGIKKHYRPREKSHRGTKVGQE